MSASVAASLACSSSTLSPFRELSEGAMNLKLYRPPHVFKGKPVYVGRSVYGS